MEPPADEDSEEQLLVEKYYQSETLHSRPFITADSDIPENLLHLWHSFGYDSERRANLHLLDERTLIFIAGNILVLIDIETKDQKYLRSCSGGGIGCIASYPTKEYFAVAEKGNQPDIVVYEYPSLRPYRVLRGGTECAYSFVDFNLDGSLLASVGCAPDYMLTLWDWRQEQVLLSCKAISQEVYRVSFSPYELDSLTSSGSQHIKFWKMASTFTGLKLQGQIGRFGKTLATDVDGYVEFPDGKVLSGASWGNLLVWDGSTIKVEICRKGGKSCHCGISQPFALEDELVMTMGSDGVIRGWDFESINTASGVDSNNRFEMEPINEMMVGHNVSLTFAVKSSLPDSFTWFAQDSRGAIWKLDLSFLSLAPDPECLFCFHAGPIKGLDVSPHSFLMATTSLDRLVKVFDFLTKKELTSSTFNQGGTTVCWAPPSVDQTGALIVTGFEDGVVRLLELYDPHKLTDAHHERRPIGEAKLRLKQAFKPHNEPVTAVAFDLNGVILATGSSDGTVFFFVTGEKYSPIGFVSVPGPVQGLEWSPHFHTENRLLILCQSGHVVEVPCPGLNPPDSTKTYRLSELPSRVFSFRSIKSQIKRNMEIARRQAIKEQKKKEKEESGKKPGHMEPEQKEEEEEELPPIYIPEDPSPLFCGFYSQPSQFWLSMGGFDTGFLYHCKFSEEQNEDLDQQQDEPFGFIQVDNAEDDSICSITFSKDRQLMLCGMLTGLIRVYPLQPNDYNLSSMKAYWALSVHDNQYGHLQHVRWSHDDQFVLTAGDDSNIFCYSLKHPDELQESLETMRAKVPSPRPGFEHEELAWDIEDPAAYSIETAKQKLEEDRLRKEAEQRVAAKRKKLAELKHRYQEMLKVNQTLSEHVHLTPEEFQLNQRFSELAEKVKLDVRRQMSWTLERATIALNKLQNGYKEHLETNMVVSVVAIETDDILSTYPLPQSGELSAFFSEHTTYDCFDMNASDAPAENLELSKVEDASSSGANEAGTNQAELTKPSERPRQDGATSQPALDAPAAPASKTDPDEESLLEEEEDLCPPMARPTGVKLTAQQEERLRKADERAVKAQAEIEERKQKWAQLYLEMPGESWEDPQCVEAIKIARENIGDLKLKSDGDYVVPKHLRMNAQQKRAQLIGLETQICQEKSEMNKRIIALRDSKIALMSQLHCQVEEVREIQKHLAADLHCSIPAVPTLLPKEIPDKKYKCNHATLQQYRILKDQRSKMSPEEQEENPKFLEQLEEAMRGQEEEQHEVMKGGTLSHSDMVLTLEEKEEEKILLNQGMKQSELEKMVLKEEDLKLMHKQKLLLEEMEKSVRHFDTEHQLLRNENLRLSMQLNMADLEQLMLFQELLILEESKTKRDALQKKLNACIKEENSIVSRLEEGYQQLELKRAEILNLQERETALIGAMQTAVSMNKLKEFLTKVFWKKIKNVKNKGPAGDEDDSEEEDSSDESDSDDDEVDDSVCPAGCESDLFEYVLKLRKRRFDLEEILTEKKRSCDTLKRNCDILAEKEKLSKNSLKVVEDDLELLYKEDQLKMNSLDIMIPLHLNQIAFETNGLVPSDLSQAVLLNRSERRQLQLRIDQQQVKNREQREINNKARQQVVRLTRDIKDKRIKLQEVKQECEQSMMRKFGKLVNMDAMMTIGGNRRLEELKQEKHLRETQQCKEIKQSSDKLAEARQALNEILTHNTKLLCQKRSFIDQRRKLEQKINLRQKKLGRQLQDQWRVADQEVQKLQQLVRTQREKAEVLKKEISLLDQKGGHVLPPDHTLPSLSSSKRQQRTPGFMQKPQSLTGANRKRLAKSPGNAGMTKLPVLPTNKSSS